MKTEGLLCFFVLMSTTFISHAYGVKFMRKMATTSTAVAFLFVNSDIPIANAAQINPNTPINGIVKGRLLKCATKSNCYSTSSVNSIDHYGTPWTFEGDSDQAWSKLVATLKTTQYLKVVEVDDDKKYIRAEGKSVVPPTGIDDVEFLMASPSDKLVTYRTNSREMIFAPGLSGPVPVSDGGSHKNRLKSILNRLEWSEMGTTKEKSNYMKENEEMNLFKRMEKASQPNEINFIDNSVPETTNN